MTSCNHMCCHSCNGFQEPFFNTTMLGLSWQGYRKTVFHTVITLPLLSQSPDLSPIEHIWDNLGRRIGHPTSLNEVEARLRQIWNEMVSRHHTELVCLNARSYRIVHSC
ncbi:uncharacterized protein TNCV_1581681 [Trichonephila clavipes]|nr:uncharacterized protein TNCV_1581681 [Trichonephila clavipes]